MTVGDYRWTAYGNSFGAATVVQAGDADVNLALVGLGSLEDQIMFWDIDGVGVPTSDAVYYLQGFLSATASPNTSVRLGDLAVVS